LIFLDGELILRRMRLRRRSADGFGTRTRAIPARSRMTIRRHAAPLTRSGQLAEALRSSREALSDLQGQLDALLAALRDPDAPIDASAVDRLRGASHQAGVAVAALSAPARRR
jgi:hypothetical protein